MHNEGASARRSAATDAVEARSRLITPSSSSSPPRSTTVAPSWGAHPSKYMSDASFRLAAGREAAAGGGAPPTETLIVRHEPQVAGLAPSTCAVDLSALVLHERARRRRTLSLTCCARAMPAVSRRCLAV
jgi:hypothetical protein